MFFPDNDLGILWATPAGEVTSLQAWPVLRHVRLAAWNLDWDRHARGNQTW